MRNAFAAALCVAIPGILAPPALAALADDPQPGFTLQSLSYPAGAVTATLSDGSFVAFDGEHVDLYDASGMLLSNLGQLPAATFPSFLLVDPTESFAVLGESSNGMIYEQQLFPSGPIPVTRLPFNYDAVFEDSDHVIVSAAATSFSVNDIYRIQVSSGRTTLLARVAGASGPVALDPQGNLYYGTVSPQFPSPPGSSRILRWRAALFTGSPFRSERRAWVGSPVLTEAQASVVRAGFDGAADMVIDPVGGGVYLAENNFGSGANRIHVVAENPLVAPILIEGTPFRTISNLEFLPGNGVAVFAGYQPPTGGALVYNTTDFVASFERRTLVTLRPTATTSGPGTSGPGEFTVGVSDGPPGGIGIVYFGPAAEYDPNETAYAYRVPLFLGLNLATAERAPGLITLDPATGAGEITYENPSGAVGLFAGQVILFEGGKLAGSSTAFFL